MICRPLFAHIAYDLGLVGLLVVVGLIVSGTL